MSNYLYDERSAINKQLQGMTDWQKNMKMFSPDSAMGGWGEENRMKNMLGAGLAAGGMGTRGTMQKMPLFQMASDFAGKRMQTRSAYEQARMMSQLQGLSAMSAPINSMLQLEQLKLQKKQMDYNNAFNWGDVLGMINFTGNIGNPLAMLGGLFKGGGGTPVGGVAGGMSYPNQQGQSFGSSPYGESPYSSGTGTGRYFPPLFS